MTDRAKCAAVVKNPFSTATAMPKIPDGKVPASLGLRRNLVTSVPFGEDSVYEMILCPHLSSPIYIGTQVNDGTNLVPKVRVNPKFGDGPIGEYTVQTGAATAKMDVDKEVSKWRLVSQGLKITLVNSNDDNDGWFEAFRFTPNYNAENWEYEGTPTAAAALPNVILKGTQFGLRRNPNTYSIADQGNYVTGKLRNIHRYTWTNRKVEKDVDFKELSDLPTLSTGDMTDIRTQLLDKDFDCIFLRIHGRGVPSGTATNCCRPTELMVHVAQNLEYIAGERNSLHKYMTKSPGGYSRRIYSSPMMYGRGYAPTMRKRTMTRRRTYARRGTSMKRRYTRK